MLSVTIVRLYDQRSVDGNSPPGLSCEKEGLFLCGRTPLVMREHDAAGKVVYRERHIAEVNFLLSAACSAQVDVSDRMRLSP